MPCLRACSLKSVAVSIRMFFSPEVIRTLDLSLLLRGLSDVQILHLQPMIGTPVDVPVPRNKIRMTTER